MTTDAAVHTTHQNIMKRVEGKAHPPRGPKPEWVHDKTFEDKPTGLAVRVKKLSLGTYRARYSLDVGSVRDNRIVPFFSPAAKIENAAVTMGHREGMTIGRLVDEATVYIGEQLQALEDRAIEDKQRRELEKQERQTQGPKKVQGLSKFTDRSKTAHEKETGKAGRHENNQAARRAEDAELRSKMKGRGK